MESEPQLAYRTEHTLGNLSAQLSLLYLLSAGESGIIERRRNEISYILLTDIRCTCYYLHGSVLSDIHLTYHKVIGICMRLYIKYLSDNDIGYLAALFLIALDL